MYDSIVNRIKFLKTVKVNEKISLTRLKKYNTLNWYQRVTDGESRHILVLDLDRLFEEINLFIQIQSEKHTPEIGKLIDLEKIFTLPDLNLDKLVKTYRDPEFDHKIKLITAKCKRMVEELKDLINQIINYEMPFNMQNIDRLTDKSLKKQAVCFFKQALEKMSREELKRMNQKMFKLLESKKKS